MPSAHRDTKTKLAACMSLTLFDNLLAPVKPAEEIPEKDFTVDINGENVPVRLIFEERFNNRVTVNKNGILLRISKKQPVAEQRKNIETLLKWAREKLNDRPALLEALPERVYMNGEILKVGSHDFTISIFYNEQSKSSAKIFKNNIVLSLAKGLTKESEANTCSYLVAKCLCRYFQPIVHERLSELNERFFKRDVKSVKLKYATSFWGHCSHDGNIVVSVRLMFAPQRVIDYVLIHELAHLVHHNHSPAFWKLVQQAMPDFAQAEVHLKENHLKYYL